jgi:hypothetical protein
MRAEITATRVAFAEQMEHLREQAKRDLSYEREKIERDKERIQEALSLTHQEAAELRGRLAAIRPSSTSPKRTKAADGDARKSGSGS